MLRWVSASLSQSCRCDKAINQTHCHYQHHHDTNPDICTKWLSDAASALFGGLGWAGVTLDPQRDKNESNKMFMSVTVRNVRSGIRVGVAARQRVIPCYFRPCGAETTGLAARHAGLACQHLGRTQEDNVAHGRYRRVHLYSKHVTRLSARHDASVVAGWMFEFLISVSHTTPPVSRPYGHRCVIPEGKKRCCGIASVKSLFVFPHLSSFLPFFVFPFTLPHL